MKKIFLFIFIILNFASVSLAENLKFKKITSLDKKTMHQKDEVMPKYAELIYNGFWFSKARYRLQKIVDLKRNKVNGSVKLKLYKGNIIIVSRQTKSNAYSMKKVSFEENKTFNKSNVERFINFHKKNLK